jgi:phytoene synthase
MPTQPAPTAAETAEVRASARAHDFDRYLAALLGPREARDDLITLAAALGEIARVPALVKEPMMGEVRLTWWRDELAKPADAAPSGHPVADAMRAVVTRHGLPQDEIEGLTEARVLDLYADPVRTEADLEAYLDATEGAGFRLAARILGLSGDENGITAAGRAFGLTRVLLSLPRHRQRVRDPLPVMVGMSAEERAALWARRALDELGRARRQLAETRVRIMPAVLPVALVEPYLRALQKPGHDPWMMPTDISPLVRVWRLWRAHLTGRV